MTNRKNDVKFHEVLKQASIYSYEKGAPLPAGYREIDHSKPNNKGFSAVVLSNGKDTIMAIRGTDFEFSPEFYRDLKNDIAMARKRIPAQLTLALDFYDEMRDRYGEMTVTGHSLGGSLAQFISIMREKACSVTFNAFGIRDMFTSRSKLNGENIINYVNEMDGVAMANGHNHVGEIYSVPNIGKGKRECHSAEGMGNLSERVQKSPAEIKEKAERLHPNSFGFVNRNSQCVGSYQVSGYTRDDGIKVSGYTRTCGAKHNN